MVRRPPHRVGGQRRPLVGLHERRLVETTAKRRGATIRQMGDFLDEYPAGDGWDEMFDGSGQPRQAYTALHEALQSLSAADFAARCSARDLSFRDQGITFSLSGEERPFPLDLVPRILSAREWPAIEAGVAQRVKALEAFLADVYGPGRILEDGLVPRRLVTTSTHYHRPAMGLEPPNGVRVHVSGIDLVRGADGVFRVLEDNLRTPSGISYVVENRRTMARVFPELFTSHRVRPVDSYPARLLEALRAATPTGSADPTVVVLTPGVHNSAYFEHAFLARQMGVELVEGRDLVCRQNRVYMRSTEGEHRVDVVYRRVDDDFLDPLHFRAESMLGCPGHPQRGPGRQRHHRQRGGQRRGRRQARLHLRPRHDPLLPRRGAIASQRGDVPPRVPRPAGGRAAPSRRVGAQAGGRVGRLRPAHRAQGHQGPAPRHAGRAPRQPPGLDRAGGRPPVDVAHPRRGAPPAPPRRPPAVRGQRRRAGVGGAGRAHPGRPPRRQPGGQLQPGRGFEGHLGAGRAGRRPGQPAPAVAGGGAGAAGAGQPPRPRPRRPPGRPTATGPAATGGPIKASRPC